MLLWKGELHRLSNRFVIVISMGPRMSSSGSVKAMSQNISPLVAALKDFPWFPDRLIRIR